MRQPQPNDRYQDKNGQRVTVRDNAFNRVTFVRDGNSAECVYPDSRFIAEFTCIDGGQACPQK
ncbi:DUF4222 domain-containing protein [Pectobacterium parmentieri]|uniref:DUF4222 domain-containing protein n=1 Tax=Pectobacterium parmentieri TaxID=1905730 RepID=UPI000CDCE06C|nr:DUF4222 domain-containing protein [Pectobacterium parmentieri]AYH04139.1 DUF4222 domain-containing protein [Pectobacterium parmentieri]AYH12960.1 DUF4222 domain-containing protein [Pectobacterium parmentieri]AYH21662.1 DUF4222 domain-containing protein [Pectobacterium parmentieri]MBN3177146.1 DUF4222 domain-containing protein [Pectobacterium parmentieri]POW25021.1 hypothetical protein PB20LOC_03561 [Pectobacterium parmentieri]